MSIVERRFHRCRAARLLALLLAVGAATCMSACSQPTLLLNGVGEAVYVADETEKRTEGSVIYFQAMCTRAGVTCPLEPAAKQWELVVLAAFNDIDERCSAYLGSLDRAKRDRAFFTRALSDVATTTRAIMDKIDPGPKALNVVEAVFSYSRNSIDTYYSRLILETEKGTILRLVTRLQTDYRNYLFKVLSGKRLDGSVGAYYAVRGYLRLCLPATIEGEIHSTLNNVGYRDAARGSTDVTHSAVLGTVEAVPLIEVSGGGGGGGTTGPGGGGGTGGSTRPPDGDLAKLRANLCLRPARGAGSMSDKDYQWALEEFRQGYFFGQGQNVRDPAEQRRIVMSSGSCANTDFASPYEKFAFVTPAKVQELHRLLSNALKSRAPETVLDPTLQKFTADTRRAIGILRAKFNLPPAFRLNNPTYIDSTLHGRLFAFDK
jgi:hypothetical protein